MTTPFYYDVVCPYAYMAFSVLHRAHAFCDGRLTLKPILLGGLFKEMGVDSNPNQSLSNVRAEYLREDLKRQAEYFKVKLIYQEGPNVSTVSAMRLITACHEDKRASLSARLFDAHWRNTANIDDAAFLLSLKTEFGIRDDDLMSAKDQLRTATAEAFSARVFGVPTMIINNERYWGADRLELVQKQLGITLPDTPWGPSSSAIEFYFDFSSPYSYLGFAEVKKAIAAGTTIIMKPIVLGALFKERGITTIPMLSAHPNKASYYLKDMRDWAEHRAVPFTFNDHFPLRTITPLRVALIEPRAIDPIFHAAWADSCDIGDENVLKGILDEAGFHGQNLLERSQDDHIKDMLKENTATAITRGVFGVPTFFVQGHKVFGQDRFLWMRRAIFG
jgi:2-hydroxychromene-2-carboxylate isomerase